MLEPSERVVIMDAMDKVSEAVRVAEETRDVLNRNAKPQLTSKSLLLNCLLLNRRGSIQSCRRGKWSASQHASTLKRDLRALELSPSTVAEDLGKVIKMTNKEFILSTL